MAGGREIRTKIKSVANTRKVTRALEMVSASKIRKAQELMRASRPYTKAMRQIMRVGYIIVSTDRGLCGGLNSNMCRQLLAEMRAWQEKGVEIDIVAIGSK